MSTDANGKYYHIKAPADKAQQKKNIKEMSEAGRKIVENSMSTEKKYDPSLCIVARKFCLLGLDNGGLARMLEISEKTIDDWTRKHPEFKQALHDGRQGADAEVAESLYKRAKGYTRKVQKAFGDVKTGEQLIVEHEEEVVPDTRAAQIWLTNRNPQIWRDRSEVKVDAKLTLEDLVRGSFDSKEEKE